jgi:RNA polymerase sigma factor (sigma-70 family)
MPADPRKNLATPAGAADDDEQAAVRRCLGGSVEAFEPIVRRHSPRLVRLAYHFLGDWEEARDVMQDAFARAFLSLARYDPRRPLGTWLCAITARLATDRLRRRRVAARATARQRQEEAPPAFDPEARLGLSEALDRLTRRQRQAVVLCDLHGFTASESAEILGCTASTVRVLRFLARRRLRDFLTTGAGPTALPDDPPEPVAVETRR